MGQCESNPLPKETPVLYYLPIAARGEVTRMICKMGGMELQDTLTDGKELDLKSFGSPGATPCFQHGNNLKLTQSHAIVSYVLNIAPKFKGLTPGEKAKDLQLNAIMDDVMSGIAKVLFSDDGLAKKGQDIAAVVEKWFPVVEAILPSTGFINRLSFPTGADFAMVVMAKGQTPFAGAFKMAGVDPYTKYRNFRGIVDRTSAVPEVKQYLESSKTMAGNPFGLPM
jgi:glutathione S-transferase